MGVFDLVGNMYYYIIEWPADAARSKYPYCKLALFWLSLKACSLINRAKPKGSDRKCGSAQVVLRITDSVASCCRNLGFLMGPYN